MENEEIDLVEVIAKLWNHWKTILRFVVCFLIVGIAVAFLLPRKYTARCTLGLEVEDRTTRISVEGMSAFQTMNMGDIRNTRIVSPAMYPDILFSVPFQKELIYSPLFVNAEGDSVTFYNYLIETKAKDGEVALVSQNGVEQLTPEENRCLGYLRRAITIEVNNKDNSLKIAVDMPDSRMAAQLAYRIQSMLQQYIAKFRITKAQAALDFIEGRYREVKSDLEQKQRALIEFREKHKDLNSVQIETEEKILNNDYELFWGLYSDIVKQLEKAKIQVKEDMPILVVIEPVVEPTSPSKPHRALIIMVAFFMGLFFGCGWVLVSPLFRQNADDKVPDLNIKKTS